MDGSVGQASAVPHSSFEEASVEQASVSLVRDGSACQALTGTSGEVFLETDIQNMASKINRMHVDRPFRNAAYFREQRRRKRKIADGP